MAIAILRGIRDAQETDDNAVDLDDAEQSKDLLHATRTAGNLADVDVPLSWADAADQEDIEHANNTTEDFFIYRDGTQQRIAYNDNQFKAKCYDEYTNEELPRHLVIAAMVDEFQYVNNVVWRGVSTDSEEVQKCKVVITRRVLCNTGDHTSCDVRARLVACEVNTYNDDSGPVYANTHHWR